MSAGFGTRPADMAAAAQRFDEASRIIGDALAGLRATLAGLGDPLGADAQGRRFAAGYHPKVEEGLAAIAAEAAAVRSLGDALRSTATEYDASDRGSAVPMHPPGG